MLVAYIVIKNLIGMHARPASDFIACARGFQSDVYVRNATRGGQLVDGKNLMQLLNADLRYRDVMRIEVEGPDEREALAALVDMASRT